MRDQARARQRVTRRIVMPDGRTKVVKHIEVSPEKAKVIRKQNEDGSQETLIRIPVSSTSRDRDGDSFTQEGLKDLKAQFDTGKIPVFFDHGFSSGMDFVPHYGVRDIRGRWTGAEIEGDVLFAIARGRMLRDRETGKRFTDPEFEEVADMVEDGDPVAASVGFFELESAAVEGSEFARDFIRTDLVETSFVGIPSNPDAVSSALGLLAKRQGVSESGLAQAILLALNQQEAPGLTEGTQQEQENQDPPAKDGEGSGQGTQDPPSGEETPSTEGQEPSGGDVTLESLQEEIRDLPEKLASAIKTALTKDSDDEEDEDKDKDKGKGGDGKTPDPKRTPASPQGRAKPPAAEPRGITSSPADPAGKDAEAPQEEKTLTMDPELRIIPYARGD